MKKVSILVVLFALVNAVAARAQTATTDSLRAPTITFSAAATADWITTYRRLSEAQKCLLPNRLERGVPFCVDGREHNPMLRPFNNNPVTTVAAGAAIDVVSLVIARKIGKRHPKLVKVALYSATAFRGFIAARNEIRLQQEQGSVRAMNESFLRSLPH